MEAVLVQLVMEVMVLIPHLIQLHQRVAVKVVEQHLMVLLAVLVVVLDADAWEKGLALSLRLRLEGCTAGCVKLLDGADPDEVDGAWLWEEARASLAAL